MGQCLSGVSFKHERTISSHSKSMRGNILYQRKGLDIEKYYEILGTIGRGSIGNVCRCRHKESGRVYALKTIKTSRMSKDIVDELMNEVEILMTLDHPNIVKPIELFSRRREIYFIMVLCTGGDLYKRAPYTENEAARIVVMITDVIDYMHTYKVVHRDIKFENVLFVNKAYDAEIMVIDFGLSKANYTVKREGKLDEFVGTLYSMAPEVIRGSYDEKCDVWSLGVVSYMLLAGAMPFTRFDDERRFLRDLEAQRYDMHRRPIAKRSDDAKNFVRSLLIANPSKRPSAAKVKKHPWIKGRRRSLTKNGEKSGTSSAASSFGMPSPDTQSLSNTTPKESSPEDNDRIDALEDSRTGYSDNNVADALSKYATSSRLRKIALMVVAHRSDTEALREIREAFRAIDTHNEGFITFDELRVVLERAHFDHENVRAIFDAVDHDGTGRISYTEFIAACLEGSSLVQEDQLAEAFDRLDSDETGTISRENLRDILGNQFTPRLVDEILAEVSLKNKNEIDKETFMSLMRGKRNKRIKEKDEGSKIPSEASKPKPRKSSKAPPKQNFTL